MPGLCNLHVMRRVSATRGPDKTVINYVFSRRARQDHYLLPKRPKRKPRLRKCSCRTRVTYLRELHRSPGMIAFYQFSVFAASRKEGLHPKLHALLERASASPFSEVSVRADGSIQSGPSPHSEVVSSGVNITRLSRDWPRASAESKSKIHELSSANPKQKRFG